MRVYANVFAMVFLFVYCNARLESKSNIDEVTRRLGGIVRGRWWRLEEGPRRGEDTGFGLGLNLGEVREKGGSAIAERRDKGESSARRRFARWFEEGGGKGGDELSGVSVGTGEREVVVETLDERGGVEKRRSGARSQMRAEGGSNEFDARWCVRCDGIYDAGDVFPREDGCRERREE